MNERLTTFTTKTRDGLKVVIHGVPTTFTNDNEEVGFRASVSSVIDHLLEVAVRSDQAATGRVELQYVPLPSQPDPVSLELRRAMRERQLSGRELAARLGVRPPVVSRWLSPNYHGHSMDALRRLADALDMQLEVQLRPKKQASKQKAV